MTPLVHILNATADQLVDQRPSVPPQEEEEDEEERQSDGVRQQVLGYAAVGVLDVDQGGLIGGRVVEVALGVVDVVGDGRGGGLVVGGQGCHVDLFVR